MMFTQCSILNRDGADLDKTKEENWIELHLGSEHPFWGFSTDLHYLGLSTDSAWCPLWGIDAVTIRLSMFLLFLFFLLVVAKSNVEY